MAENDVRKVETRVGEVTAILARDFDVSLGGFPKGTDLWLWFLESPENGALWCFGVSDDFEETHAEDLMRCLSSIEWLKKITVFKGTMRANFGCPHCEAIAHYQAVAQMPRGVHDMMMSAPIEELVESRKTGDFRAWEQIHAIPNGLPKQSMN